MPAAGRCGVSSQADGTFARARRLTSDGMNAGAKRMQRLTRQRLTRQRLTRQRVTRWFGLAVAGPLLGALLLCAPGSDQGFAQAPTKGPGATRTVNLTLEQRHVIRELVKEL